MILDAGFLVAVDRAEEAAKVFVAAAIRTASELHTTEPVVAQVWRNGAQQARLAAFIKTIVVHPFDDGRSVGRLLGQTETTDVVDAHLVVCALRLGDDILTGDTDDFALLTSVLGPAAPRVRSWP